MSNEHFSLINSPKTVLYFKRLDQMTSKVCRQHLLNLMSNHLVTLGDGKIHFAKNILFTIGTIFSKEIDYFEWSEIADKFVDIVDLDNL